MPGCVLRSRSHVWDCLILVLGNEETKLFGNIVGRGYLEIQQDHGMVEEVGHL